VAGRRKAEQTEEGGLPRLPPGRHGLPREFVVSNQKGRIAAALIEVMVSDGYLAASVTRIVAAAGVSRRTFYNYYGDKSEAFFDVYGEVSGFLLGAMREAGEATKGGWAGKVRARLEALLAAVDANPDLARFCLAVPTAAGGEVAAVQRRFLKEVVDVLAEDRPKKARRPPEAAEYAMVGGLAALIIGSIDAASGDVRDLLPEVLELVLAPYLGRDTAAHAAAS
jgi:AcrR family transcriptional regulator